MGKRRRLFRLRTGGDGEAERELREEIEAHIELRVEDLVRRGVSESEAREMALRRFGDPEAAWEDLRASVRRRERRLKVMAAGDSFVRSLLLTCRQWRRAPGYVALSVLTLALGVGLTTAAFTVTDHVLLRPLPYVEADRLVALHSQGEEGATRISVSVENWLDWKDSNTTLEASALHRSGTVSVGDESGARRVRMEEVTGDFFRVMRTPMVLGRGFTDDEAQAESRVAVVSETFWRSQLGAPPELPVELRLDGRSWQVIGVVPDAQAYPASRQIWVPYRYRSWNASARNWINWSAIARLSEGATIEHADEDLDGIAERIRREAPEALYSWGVWVDPLRDDVVGDAREDLDPLLVAAILILLIGCANVAGMSLARTLSRREEVAVHIALGAGRGRVVRQIVAGHLYLGLAGGALGVLVAWLATRLLVTHAAYLVPRAGEIGMDGRILAFGVVASLVTGVLAGAIPAWRASGFSVRTALEGARGVVGGGRTRAGAILVGAEVAIALVLLASCGLLIRSFASLLSRDLGYRVDHVVVAEAVLNSPSYDLDADEWRDHRIQYWEEVLAGVRGLAGVRAVAVGNRVPTGSAANGFIRVPGWPEPSPVAGYSAISADYFEVLGIPLLMGRVFDERDQPGTQRVTVINRAMAEKYWPGRNPVGQTVHATSMEAALTGEAPPLTVIGVVGNVRFGFDSDVRPEMFTVWTQVPLFAGEMTVLVYAPDTGAGEMALRIQRPLAEVDPEVAVEIATLEGRLGASTRERRFIMSSLSGFAALALGLAGVGIYGLLSFTLAQRTREMGIRTALGAQRIGIVGLMMSRAARIVGGGVAIGLMLAFWLTRAMDSMLVDVTPWDPLTYVAALSVLGLCCATAAFVPAWRASRTDPLVALRTH